ncbi:MinD/ParA family ATP-binding protein [Leeia oryzae]|uniref:MinD/ParA family ATP-binding protein n=1 Tax=Leeia oryzae TaxID=356662 RepID=UPI0003757333|nr:cellulose synthase operon protein YhjQ/BcsQ [Leeia oryzae]
MEPFNSSRNDQASGLRRLFDQRQMRSIGFVGGRGRVGKTSLVVNLGAALTALGKRVLILDEFAGSSNVTARLGLYPRYGISAVLNGQQPLSSLVLEAQPDLLVLPFATPASALAMLSEEAERRLTDDFAELSEDIDFLLVDARPLTSPDQPSMALVTEERIIVLADRAEAITDAYTFIKLLSQHFAKRDFWLLVNRMKDYPSAQKLFNRIAQVARKFTDADVRMLGFVPEDEKLHRANHLLHPLIPAFTDAEASQACLQLAEALTRLAPASSASTTPSAFMHRLIASCRAFVPPVLQ